MAVEFSCPICGNKHFIKKLICRDHTVSAESFDIVDCSACNFRITFPPPLGEHLGNYYMSEKYISHSGTNKGLINQLYHLVRKFTLNSKLKLINSLSSKGEILDVGCGTASFLLHCKKNGWKISGVETDLNARELAIQRLEQKVYESCDLNNFVQGQFDIITLWHVLEHIPNLSQMINDLDILLKKGGLLLVAVPNSNAFDASYYKETWAAYDVPRHLWHFTPLSIERFLSKHSFKLIKVLPMWFDSFYVSMLSEKHKNSFAGIFKGLLVGLISNWKSFNSSENICSSQIYLFKKK